MVKAVQRSAQGREFEPRHKQLFAFVFYAHEDLNLYIQCIYLVCTLYEQCLNKYVHDHGCKYRVYVYIPGLNKG